MNIDTHSNQHEKYILSIGSFIDNFSRLETTIRFILLREAGIDERRLEILAGVPGITQAVTMVKKLSDLSEIPEKDKKAIERAITQLNDIRALRDRIVHSGGNPVNDMEWGEILIRDVWKKRSESGKEKINFFTFPEINNAILDMQTINYIFLYHFSWRNRDDFEKSLLIHAQAPWRFSKKSQKITSNATSKKSGH